MAPNPGSLRIQRRNDRGEKLICHCCPFGSGKILLEKRLRRMLTDAEKGKAATALKCTHVPVSGFPTNAPNQSRVVRIIPWMNRRCRAQRHKVITLRVRFCTGVLNVHIQLDKKIVLLLARLQQGKFLSDRDSISRG